MRIARKDFYCSFENYIPDPLADHNLLMLVKVLSTETKENILNKR